METYKKLEQVFEKIFNAVKTNSRTVAALTVFSVKATETITELKKQIDRLEKKIDSLEKKNVRKVTDSKDFFN